MIFGIGTDIVSIQRLRADLERYGDRFAQRILVDEEMVEFRQAGQKAHFLAKRFAAKEAAAKALGTGFRDGVSLHDIAVGHDERGKPLLVFSERLAKRLVERGVADAGHLSLTDEQEYAVAFVVLEKLS
jgi:holo-[acyl-carrier protein] synthase